MRTTLAVVALVGLGLLLFALLSGGEGESTPASPTPTAPVPPVRDTPLGVVDRRSRDVIAERTGKAASKPQANPALYHPTETRLRVVVKAGELGLPAPGVSVAARVAISGGDRDRILHEHHTTDEGGEAYVRLEPWSYLEDCSVTVWAWGGGRVGMERVLHVSPGVEQALEIVLGSAATVGGVVRDARTKRPVAGAEVIVDGPGFIDPTFTDENGSYLLSDLPANGTGWYIKAVTKEHGPESALIRVFPDGRWTRPDLKGSEEGRPPPVVVDLELVPALEIKGVVLESTTGAAVSDADVHAKGYYTSIEGISLPDLAASRSASDGSFVLSGLRSDIAHGIYVSKEGFASERIDVPAEGGGEYDCGTIHLDTGCELIGVVTDADGFPAEAVEVRLVGPSVPPSSPTEIEPSLRDARIRPATSRSTRTSREGRYSFADLPAEDYRVKVLAGPRVVVAEELRLASPIQVHDLRLPGDEVAVLGQVVREGRPEAGALVFAGKPGRRRMVTSDEHGWFRIAAVGDRETQIFAVKMDEDETRYVSPTTWVRDSIRTVRLSLRPDR